MNNEKRTARKGDGPALKLSLTYRDCTVNVDLKDDVRVVVFHTIKEPPEEAGLYNVIDKAGWIHTMEYTADGGWNTYFDSSIGEIYEEFAMDPETCGFVGWAKVIKMEG